MIKQVLIDKTNIFLATNIQNIIFPHYSAYQNYYESVNKISKNDYYILYDNNTPIGISGIYELDNDKNSAWLGWFGILKEYRRNHYGLEAIKLYEEEAKRRGYLYTRIYTDRYDNDATLTFYDRCGYQREEYNNDSDVASIKYPLYIYSKAIKDTPLIPWNNLNIDLTSQIEKQDNFAIVNLTENNIDELLGLYEECFLTDHYFVEYFKGKDLIDIMNHSFKQIFRFVINKNNAFGIFQKGKLISFLLCFDYFDTLSNHKKEFNNIFTSDDNNDNYSYQEKLHDRILSYKNNVMYMLAIAVKKDERNKGIATILFNFFLNKYRDKVIVSDVSNSKSLFLYKKNNFNISEIDKDYYFVMREPNK